MLNAVCNVAAFKNNYMELLLFQAVSHYVYTANS